MQFNMFDGPKNEIIDEKLRLNNGKQMKDVWSGSLTKPSEKKFGKHPTQKPEYLLEKIILSSSNEEDLVLDPFCGSSTTGVVCQKYNRRYIGIDLDATYLQLSKDRLQANEQTRL